MQSKLVKRSEIMLQFICAALAPNAKRIWNICTQDKRMRAAVISYIFPSVWFALCESYKFFDEEGSFTIGPIVRFVGLALAIYILSEPQYYKFSMQAFVLGVVCGVSISIGLTSASSHIQIFCTYTYIFAMFHYSEFFVTGLTNLESLRFDSFLLNHSTTYWIAASASWLEFIVEGFLFPTFYSRRLCAFGVIVCVIGEILRKLAMCHAATGFTHQIAVRRQKHHTLITSGVYSLCRHPGYLGWLLWSIGTQLILCNPVCLIIYARITYHFFNDRIHEEERYLIEFFGQRYIDYQQKVGVGIPGIRGFTPSF